jgi:hypothetical protein
MYMPLTKSFPFFIFPILEKVKVEVKSFRIFWDKQQQVGSAYSLNKILKSEGENIIGKE